jgi:transposase
MRPVSVFAHGPDCEVEQLEADLHGRWRQATRAVMVLLSLQGLPPAHIAVLLGCHPPTVRRWISRFNCQEAAGLADRPRSGRPRLDGLPRRAVVLAEDETHLHLLPHIRASWTPRGTRPHIRTPHKNRQVTVFEASDVSTGAWVYRLGRRLHGGVAQGSGDCSGGQVRRVSSIGLISPTSLPSGSATIAYRAPQKASNGGWRPTYPAEVSSAYRWSTASRLGSENPTMTLTPAGSARHAACHSRADSAVSSSRLKPLGVLN